MSHPPPILEIRNLSFQFGSRGPGLQDISLTVDPGECLILAGQNGSGKTTLLRLLMGLIRPRSGEIRLNGQDIFKDLRQTRKTMGLVFQDADTQILGETVGAEIAFGPENLGLPREEIRQIVNRAMDHCGLSGMADRHPATLSGGEKRRLTIAGVLAMDPEILLFDEPYANLDYGASGRLTQRIAELQNSGKTLIVATHELDQVLPLADRIMVMDQGRIIADDAPAALAPRLGSLGLKPWCPACQPLKDAHGSPVAL